MVPIHLRDIQISVLIVFVYALFHLDKVSLLLTGDELYHSQSAIAASKKLISEMPDSLTALFLNQDARLLITLTQICVIAILFVLYKIQGKFGSGYVATITFASLFLFNLLAVGYGYKYPSGYIIPQFLGSVLFISDFFFRIVQVFVFAMVLVVSSRSIRESHGGFSQVLLISGIFSLPVISFGLIYIDQAAYFGILAGIALFQQVLISMDPTSREKIRNASVFLAFLIMVRSSALLLLITFALIILFSRIERKTLKSTYPLIAIVPILLASSLDLIRSIRQPAFSQDGIAFSTTSNPVLALFSSIFTEFDNFSLILLIASISTIIMHPSTRRIVLIYTGIIFSIYAFQVPTAVLGHNKYAFESMTPFVFLAFFLLISSRLFKELSKKTVIVIGLILFTFSTFVSTSINPEEMDKKMDNWNQVPNFLSVPIEKSGVSDYLSENGLVYDCINVGFTYGYFSTISQARTLEELKTLEERNLIPPQTLEWGQGIKGDLDLNSYGCLIIDNYPAKAKLRGVLKNLGYEQVYSEKGDKFGIRTEVWVKSD